MLGNPVKARLSWAMLTNSRNARIVQAMFGYPKLMLEFTKQRQTSQGISWLSEEILGKLRQCQASLGISRLSHDNARLAREMLGLPRLSDPRLGLPRH
jgi:hypothetical protein